MPSTSIIPNAIDRNAGSANRQRRNWQRLSQGAATGTIKTSAPITGGSTVGLSFLTTSGLGLTSSALAILFADASITGSASGIKVHLAASSSALSTTAAGLKVLVDGSTITVNGAGQLQAASTGGGGGSTAIIAADATIVVGTSTGSTTLKVGTLTSTNLPGDIAYTDKANVFTSTQTVPNLIVSSNINLSSGSLVNYAGSLVFQAIPSQDAYFLGGAGNLVMAGLRNLGFGPSALSVTGAGNDNIAIGWHALQGNGDGSDNIAIGSGASQNNSLSIFGFGPSRNVAIGSNSLNVNSTGSDNIAIGSEAMLQGQDCSANIAIGSDALSLVTGSDNTAIGHECMLLTTAGTENAAVGKLALFRTTTGAGNVGFGYLSGVSNTTGSFNIYLGSYSTISGGITTGNANIVIGNSITSLPSTGSNNLCIGNLIFGTGLTGGSTISAGKIGIGISSPAFTLDVAGTARTSAKMLASTGLGVGNSAVASIAVGTLVGKFELFDAMGASLGFVPIYSSIT